MNFCVVPREIREINKRGGGSKYAAGEGISENHEKNKCPSVYFEPEGKRFTSFCLLLAEVHQK